MSSFFATRPEFGFIEAFLGQKRLGHLGVTPGDDAYLLRHSDGSQWAISTDASVEGVHFRLDFTTPSMALRKAIISNLSDINAMGGSTSHALLCLGAKQDWDENIARDLGEALNGLEAEFGFSLVGGDTVRVPRDCFFAITVLGQVLGKPLLRSASRPGDTLYVSGNLGGSPAGLQLLLQKGAMTTTSEIQNTLCMAHLNPTPPLRLGPALALLPGPVAAIDLSDGLSSELNHLSRQSACRMVVEWVKLPYDPRLAELSPSTSLLREWVLHGGEEYQLIFTGQFTAEELRLLNSHATLHAIGRVEAGEGVWLQEPDGQQVLLLPGGFSH